MLKAIRKNRVVQIPEERLDDYKKLGYKITTMDDKPVYTPENKDETIAALRRENELLRHENAELREAAAKKPTKQKK